jgi:hypothetical protein
LYIVSSTQRGCHTSKKYIYMYVSAPLYTPILCVYMECVYPRALACVCVATVNNEVAEN